MSISKLSAPLAQLLLQEIPDWTDWTQARDWMERGQREILEMAPAPIGVENSIGMQWSQINDAEPSHCHSPGPNSAMGSASPFERYGSPRWRKFVLAALLADWACYASNDRVDFARLCYVMHQFPQGFKIWWSQLANRAWWPVGYSAWYPMPESLFNIFEHHPEQLKDRMVPPSPGTRSTQDEAGPFLYLFNYSAAPKFRKSTLSKMLMLHYAQEIKAQSPKGLACITVSQEGAQVAHRFGMSCSGRLKSAGKPEQVYLKRSAPPALAN